ncbi:MAG: lamin tail domain-containing protein [Verrucomicrobiota bacterium]
MASSVLLNPLMILGTGIVLLAWGTGRAPAAELLPPVLSPAGGWVHAPALAEVSHNNAAGTVFYTINGPDPRDPFGEVAREARRAPENLSVNRPMVVRARVRAGAEWSQLVVAAFTVDQDFSKLLFTEMMYHPRDNDDWEEFIELKNAGSVPLDLTGLQINFGYEDYRPFLSYTFPAKTIVAPGGFQVLIAQLQAYRALHPSARADGILQGGMSNDRGSLAVQTAAGAVAATASYDTAAPWQVVPDNHGYFAEDGVGFSLVRRSADPQLNPEDYRNWRASAQRYGSPGADDPPPTVPPVYINELMSRSNAGELDYVEFYNPNAQPVDLGGWWLSDERNDPFRYAIPAGTVVPAGGYLVLDESQYGAGVSFNTEGERCYLFSGDQNGVLTGYSHGFQFRGAERGMSFGRHPASDGREDFPLQMAPTPGAPNAGPRVPPVVISRSLYRPAMVGETYVELYNTTDAAINLWDPGNPGSTWALGDLWNSPVPFPGNTVIPAKGHVLVVGSDPATFRVRNQVPEAVTIVRLQGLSFDSFIRYGVSLFQPSGLAAGVIRYVELERVGYGTAAPWPSGADAPGHSLERIHPERYANDPQNWREAPVGLFPGRPIRGNLPPRVWAGGPQTHFARREATLTGVVADDQYGGMAPTLTWSQTSGPAAIQFTHPGQATVQASFPVAGQYGVRLQVSDGLSAVEDTATISVLDGAFEGWRAQYFPPVAPGAEDRGSPGADPDGDGLRNDAEYMFNSVPTVAGSPNPLRITYSGGRWEATWEQRAGPADYLVTLESAAGLDGPWLSDPEFFERTETNQGTLTKVVVREKYPTPGRPGGFIRLRYGLK